MIYVYRDGKMVPKEDTERPMAPLVMGDIQPYQSMIDGSTITSRSKHRTHLRDHECLEVGDQTHHLKPFGTYNSPPGLKETLIRVANEKLR